jgi:aminoglycoside phosphotransferase (APT) family kinase protein
MGRENRKTLAWLDTPHRIAPLTVERLRALITSWPTPTATLVPTQGDWQPRNWLVDDDGVVSVIDFGRAALRPAMTGLAGLEAQQFRGQRTWSAISSTGMAPTPASPRRGSAPS